MLVICWDSCKLSNLLIQAVRAARKGPSGNSLLAQLGLSLRLLLGATYIQLLAVYVLAVQFLHRIMRALRVLKVDKAKALGAILLILHPATTSWDLLALPWDSQPHTQSSRTVSTATHTSSKTLCARAHGCWGGGGAVPQRQIMGCR